jgi:hypothetical protein
MNWIGSKRCFWLFLAAVEVAAGTNEIDAAPMLPALDGSAYPGYRQVFQSGECTRNDGRPHPVPGGQGTTLIDTDKICFSCFRVPTLLAGQTPGVIHAFA